MQDTTLLIAQRDGDTTRLLSPGVGTFTCAVPAGCLLGPGQDAGVLLVTGRPLYLRVPAGVAGRVTNTVPEKVHAPVGFRTTLYELAPLESGVELECEAAAAEGEHGLYLLAPQTGRFYQRPAPDDEPFVQPGDTVTGGTALGLIEVMKTFAHVTYTPSGPLPARATVKRYVAADGAEVREGEPLLEFE